MGSFSNTIIHSTFTVRVMQDTGNSSRILQKVDVSVELAKLKLN